MLSPPSPVISDIRLVKVNDVIAFGKNNNQPSANKLAYSHSNPAKKKENSNSNIPQALFKSNNYNENNNTKS